MSNMNIRTYLSFLISFLLVLVALSAFLSCGIKTVQSDSRPITHELWTRLLQQHVSENGTVDYSGFQRDSAAFNQYLDLLKSHHPNNQYWTHTERLAYWINAYNAFTVKLVADHYPTASIKDIRRGIPFVNSVWDVKFIKIEDAVYDLNNIEHNILRKQFDEPRIHFAINCASISCPRLRNEAFTPDRLEAQLTDQARYFLANEVKNKIEPDRVQLSKIFRWFKGDFTKGQRLIEFLNRYSPVPIRANASVDYLDYDWGIND